MPAEEILLAAEHMHRAALALGITAAAARQLRHHALGVHAAGQHMAVIAIARQHGISGRDCRLHADDNGFLADIKVAKSADQPHAIHLPRAFLKTADQQHVAIIFDQCFGIVVRAPGAVGAIYFFRGRFCNC